LESCAPSDFPIERSNCNKPSFDMTKQLVGKEG
jgi:hypothetical protein